MEGREFWRHSKDRQTTGYQSRLIDYDIVNVHAEGRIDASAPILDSRRVWECGMCGVWGTGVDNLLGRGRFYKESKGRLTYTTMHTFEGLAIIM